MLNITDQSNRYRAYLIVFVLLLLILRVPLITKGHMHFPDEIRYRYAFGVIDKFEQKDLTGAFSDFFRSYNRPSFILLSVPLAYMQRVMDPNVGKDLSKPDKDDLRTYFIPSFFNVIASIMLVLLVYNWILTFTGNSAISMLGAICFSMLNTSYMEIRHILPYYFCECIFLFILLKIFQAGDHLHLKNRELFLYGLLTGFGFSYYPAYYYLPFFIILVIFCLSERRLKDSGIFLLSFLTVPMIYEIISKFTVTPYFIDSVKMEKMYEALPVSHEVFSSGSLVWIFKYMLGVEGITGGIILVLSLLFMYKCFSKAGYPKRLKVLYIGMILNYVFVILMILFTGKMGIRAKYYYPYVFIFLISTFLLLNEIIKYRKVFLVIFTGICIVSFVFFYSCYLKVVYPRDVRQFVREYYNEPSIVCISAGDESKVKNMKKQMINIYEPRFVGVNIRFDGSSQKLGFEDNRNIISIPHTNGVYKPYGGKILEPADRFGKMDIYELWETEKS